MSATYETIGPTVDSPVTGLLPYFLGSKNKDTGFGSTSTAADVAKNWDGTGKVAIVTGANIGLGEEAARVLASRGCEVIIAVRSTSKGDAAADKIRARHADAKVSVMQLDLSSLASVRAFVKAFKATGKPTHILIANAGVMACPFTLSADGLELQFATNHLGHFLLVTELLDTMLGTANSSNIEGRIVMLSSSAHFNPYSKAAGGPVRFDKLASDDGYTKWSSYGQSKLCNVLFARELNKRLEAQPITVVACHPGGIIDTDLTRHLGVPAFANAVLRIGLRPLFKNIPQGAATEVLCATAPGIKRGEYYADCMVHGSSTASHDAALGAKLWEVSKKLVAEKCPAA